MSARASTDTCYADSVQRLILIVIALVLTACRSTSSDPRTENKPSGTTAELREFAGSYPVAAPKNGAVRELELVAAETVLPLVDGTQMRVWSYNGTVPGPTFRVRLGETVRVHFTNKLPQSTTIHWHGVRVPNAMDGVPHLTQAEIGPGQSFVYEFAPKDAGTFWFHPHIRAAEQVERGLYGVLVVEDAVPLPFTRDVVWVLDDWLRDGSGQIDERFVTPHDLAHDGRWGNVITTNGTTKESLVVGSGDRIRLRLINTANGRVFKPDFSGLDAKVIAIDGMYLRQPIPPDGLELAPGNRVDLDIDMTSARANRIPIVDRYVARAPNHLADVVVGMETPPAPGFPSPAHAHVPKWSDALLLPAHHDYQLDARRGGPYGIEWTIDGVAMRDHAVAPSVTLERGKFYRLRFTNASYRIHPIHLHGMFFRLLARNGASVEEPFFRDTVLVHGKESIDIGVVPLDEGRWMMHCHILEHAEAGMMTTIDVRNGS
jgi:FtsP/CotA-like multicopper oxidase with cupredoxin domain